MTKTTKIVFWIIGIVIVIGVAYFSIKNLGGINLDNSITIGAILPMTGDAGEYGQAAKNGIDLAVAKVLKDENINLKVVYEDDQLDSTKAVNAVNKLINVDNLKYLITFSSQETLAICPITGLSKAILLTTGSAPDIATKCGDYTFKSYPPDNFQGKALADIIYSKGYKKVAVFYINNDVGIELKDEFTKDYKGQISDSEFYNLNDTDFKTQLTKIKSTNPDAILLLSILKEGTIILKQRTELGMNQPIFASESMKLPGLIQNVSKDSLKNVFITFISQYNGKEMQEFKDSYKQKYNTDFGSYSDYVYDNDLTLANAIKECGGASNVDCVKNNIYKTDIIGATGSINFDNNASRVGKPYTLYKIENNDFVPAE